MFINISNLLTNSLIKVQYLVSKYCSFVFLDMAAPEIGEDGIILDILGQQLLPIYTQICFCFSITDDSIYLQLIETLEAALEKLHAAFPWLAGRVVNEGAITGNTGVFKIKSLGSQNRLLVKDIRDDSSFPSMEVLRRTRFPINALDQSILAPRDTQIDTNNSDPPEVLLVQATLIKGGLILTFLGQHQAMDGIGQDQIIRLFSKACRNEDFTSEERLLGNLAPGNDIPLLDASCELPSNLDHQIMRPQSSPSESQESPAVCTWANFSFPSSSLETLKTTANATSTSKFVSTDDALTAFIWRSVTSARLARLSPTTPSTLARAVDVRSLFGISQMYPGFLQNMTYNTCTFQELVEMPLGVLASKLRFKIDPETSTLAHDTRSLATLLANSPEKSSVSFAACLNWGSDVFFSSWTKMKAYEYDFGPGLGRAEAVRRTRSHTTEGLMYLMPKAPNGGIELVMCLSEDDMGMLRGNEEFLRLAEYVG
ncbi:hypothetical protein Q7P37_001082 [Cladosporium fusiforme]